MSKKRNHAPPAGRRSQSDRGDGELPRPKAANLCIPRPQRYNRDADELACLASQPPGPAPVAQVNVGPDHRLVDHLSTDLEGIRASMRLGATAMARLVLQAPATLPVDARPLEAAA